MKIHFDGDKSNIQNIIDVLPDFTETSITECNFIISCKLPWSILNSQTIQKIILSYKNINKIVFIFLISDNPNTFHIPHNIRLFRTSLFKSKRKKNEYCLPYIWEGYNIPFKPLKKDYKPIVGFCGFVNHYRDKTMQKISQQKNIICNFIPRNQFWGGKPHDSVLKEQFQNNIFSSHFTICNRGNGNFSMRFYQTLSAGRIPILIDTDILLPFEDEIDWHNIIIMKKNENDLIKTLFHWWNHRNIEEIQQKCRKIYETYFETKAFFTKILSPL
jgi:hypothetical protein